jgi:signal transduction histidine kinase
LRNIINKVFDAIPENEKATIINRWSSFRVEYGIRPGDVLKWALVVGGSAFGILLLFVFWNRSLRRQVHLRTAELDSSIQSLRAEITARKQKEQQLEAYQNRLKALASQLTVAEERERRTLAADLHDHVGHSLALARMQLNGILEAQSELERTMLVKDISHILLKSFQDTRSLIFELSSPSLNEIGLGAAVSEWLEEHVGKRYGLKTEFIDEIDEKFGKTLDDNVRAVLFRNVRELLTNVIKYAKAEKVSVYLENDDTMLTVIVEDDGVGFDTQAATPPGEEKGGFGLFSIQERMTDMGGTFDIRSEPGKGCKAIMSLPIEKKVE